MSPDNSKRRKLYVNKIDPFSAESVYNLVNPIVIEQSEKKYCFDLLGIVKQLFVKPANPFTREPFTTEQIKEIFDKVSETTLRNRRSLASKPEVCKSNPIELNYSICERELFDRLNEVCTKINKLVCRGNFYEIYQIYRDFTIEVKTRLNRAAVVRFPSVIIKETKKLESIILTIIEQGIKEMKAK